MKLLFELYTTQIQISGAAEYIRKVFYTLLQYVKERELDVEIIPLIDSSYGKYSYADLEPKSLREMGLNVADLRDHSINDIIEGYAIDKFFFGLAQIAGKKFNLENIHIPGICVVHDLCDEEFASSCVIELPNMPYDISTLLHRFAGLLKRKIIRNSYDPRNDMKNVMKLAKSNSGVKLVTVSNYTKYSIDYFFNYPVSSIPVLYSCERINIGNERIDDCTIFEVINSKKKYLLMLSANRPMKNIHHCIPAFKRFVESGHNDIYLITTGYKSKEFDNHIPLGYVTDNDLVALMKNCYALLFPSFFEVLDIHPLKL